MRTGVEYIAFRNGLNFSDFGEQCEALYGNEPSSYCRFKIFVVAVSQ